MALSRKRQPLYALQADIAVIPECAKKCVDLCIEDGFDGCWLGDNPNKGLGVLIRKPWRIARIGKPCNKWVVPLSIVGGSHDFLLIAVWTTLIRGNLERSYIGQISEAVLQNPRWFAKNKVIIAGDFNSNTRWDGKRELHTHSRLVRQLEKHGLISTYHQFFSETQACETRPTYYQWHRREPAFHIDYVFIPECWATQMKSVEVGEYDVWSKLSDHVPLTVNIHDLGSMPSHGQSLAASSLAVGAQFVLLISSFEGLK
jgi:exodeoxyribonuclease-3